MKRIVVSVLCLALGGFFLLAVVGCAPEQGIDPARSSIEAESATRRFYELISAYDYDGLRAASSPDFEILEAGFRMDLDDFVSMLEGMEAQNVELSFEVADFNTEVSGDVAYTTNRMISASGSAHLEAFILRRTDAGWLVDRAFSTSAARPGR